MPIIQKDDLKGITAMSEYGDSTIYTLNSKNIINCECGTLIPQHSEGDVRKKYNGSISISKDGHLRSVSLEDTTEIITPLGPMPAELVTFYDTGEIKRVFPVNGKISGYWSEQDEKEICPVLNLDLPFSKFRSRIINICFYRSGNIRSVTLWPGERIYVDSPCGRIRIRNGFSLYENGKIRSVEPADPIKITTPIGNIVAFDPTALGINADTGSITFFEDGMISSIKTIANKVRIFSDASVVNMSPRLEHSMTSDDEWTVVPMDIGFTKDGIMFDSMGPYNKDSDLFSIEDYRNPTVVHGHPIIPNQ